jgi:hypothetical protein
VRREIQPKWRESWEAYWDRLVREEKREQGGLIPGDYALSKTKRRYVIRKALVSLIVVGPRYIAVLDRVLAERKGYRFEVEQMRERAVRVVEDAMKRATPDELVIADHLQGANALPSGREGRT